MAARRTSGRRSVGRRHGPGRLLAVVAAAALLLAACGEDEPPELTIEERLAEAEGRELTATEVDQKLTLGDTLCRMDEQILDAIWFRLDDDQLAYQDVVFGHLCPERSVFYAGQTGRFVTEEAENSGIATSTTRPDGATTGDATVTSGRATIAPAPADSSTTADPAVSTSDSEPSTESGSTVTATSSSTANPSATSTSSAASSTRPGEGG